MINFRTDPKTLRVEGGELARWWIGQKYFLRKTVPISALSIAIHIILLLQHRQDFWPCRLTLILRTWASQAFFEACALIWSFFEQFPVTFLNFLWSAKILQNYWEILFWSLKTEEFWTWLPQVLVHWSHFITQLTHIGLRGPLQRMWQWYDNLDCFYEQYANVFYSTIHCEALKGVSDLIQ